MASTGAGSSGKWKSPSWTCSELMRSAHVLWTSPTTCSPRSKHSLTGPLTCSHHMVAISSAVTQQLGVPALHMSSEHQYNSWKSRCCVMLQWHCGPVLCHCHMLTLLRHFFQLRAQCVCHAVYPVFQTHQHSCGHFHGVKLAPLDCLGMFADPV